MNFSTIANYPFTVVGFLAGLFYEAIYDIKISLVATALIPSDELIISVIVGFCADIALQHFTTKSFSNAKGSGKRRQSSYSKEADETFDSRKVYVELLFTLFAKLANSDGIVSTAEIETVERIIKESFSFDDQTKQLALETFRRANRDRTSFSKTVAKFRLHFGHDHLLVERLIEMLIRLAEADGAMTKTEEDLLWDAANSLGCRLDDFARVKDHARSSNQTFSYLNPEEERCYLCLQCSPQSTNKEIKQAFRQLAHKYHPDKFSDAEKSPELLSEHEQMFREIRKAYDYLCTIRDIR